MILALDYNCVVPHPLEELLAIEQICYALDVQEYLGGWRAKQAIVVQQAIPSPKILLIVNGFEIYLTKNKA